MYQTEQCCQCWDYTPTGVTRVRMKRWGKTRSFEGDLCFHCNQVLETMLEQMVRTSAHVPTHRQASFELQAG